MQTNAADARTGGNFQPHATERKAVFDTEQDRMLGISRQAAKPSKQTDLAVQHNRRPRTYPFSELEVELRT